MKKALNLGLLIQNSVLFWNVCAFCIFGIKNFCLASINGEQQATIP